MRNNIEGSVVLIALDAGMSDGPRLDSITLENYGIQIPEPATLGSRNWKENSNEANSDKGRHSGCNDHGSGRL